MYHDPYSGQQIKAFRRDPTGRWSPIIEAEEDSSIDFIDVVIIALFCVIVAIFLVWRM